MNICTRIFGEIEVNFEKLITFVDGIIGFPDLKQFMLIHDVETNSNSVSWLQSIDEPEFAMPVINPLLVLHDYNPIIEDELLKSLGELKPEEMLVLVTMTVPSDVTKISVNLKAPILINTQNLNASQIIVDDEKYPVKYPVHDILKNKKEGSVC